MRILLVLAVGALALGIRARPLAYADEVKITPAVQRKLAEALGLDPRSPRVNEILASYRQSQKPAPPPLAQPDPTPAPIVKYIRGKEGAPFSAPPKPIEERIDFRGAESFQKKALGEMAAEFKRQITPVKLPRCSESSTKKTKFKKVGAKDRRVTAFDLLVIGAREMPLDGEEIFGNQPLLVAYEDEATHGGSLAALGVGVDCLPFRMRVTTGGTYIHRGLDALRNYDEDVDGTGTLDERATAIWEKMQR